MTNLLDEIERAVKDIEDAWREREMTGTVVFANSDDTMQWDAKERIKKAVAALKARPEERAPLLAEWISPEPTPEMIAAVSTILQPYAAKLVWARMLKVALIPPPPMNCDPQRKP